MKVLAACLVFAVTLAVASAALTCMMDKDKCAEDECCVRLGPAGRCKKLQELDKPCEVHPGKLPLRDHVYLFMCPCGAGLKCVPKDGLVGKLMGTCQEDSGEEE
ncbi:U1-hexatoxin-Iw1e-like [Uloborus diversus]|uniref:U1-hexatoxin-Iw1e-like n=1 Tax=Uloborus diversus TaxID=327109 RepID=UPI002409928D|nr:U1-hexatoxin-Iw1e-like [Uloborus diversus]